VLQCLRCFTAKIYIPSTISSRDNPSYPSAMTKKIKVPKPVKYITIVNKEDCETTACNDGDVDFDEDNSIVSAESLNTSGDTSECDSYADDSNSCSSSDELLSFSSRNVSTSSLSRCLDMDDSSFPVSSKLEPDPRSSMYLPNDLSSCLENKGKLSQYPYELYPDCDPSGSTTGSRHGNAGPSFLNSKSLTSDLSIASITLRTNSFPCDVTATSQSCASSVPTAVSFANECLERSEMRRSYNNFDSLPSSLTIRPRTQSSNDETAVTCLSAESNKLVSTSVSCTSHMSSISSSALSKLSETTAANIEMIEDYEHSPRAGRVVKIKRQMRSMEIQYYRTKCVRSLRRSMVLSMQIEISADDESSTGSLEPERLAVPSGDENPEGISATKGHSQTAMEVVRDIICFNILLAIMYMFYILYKDSIMDAMQRIDDFRWVGVSS